MYPEEVPKRNTTSSGRINGNSNNNGNVHNNTNHVVHEGKNNDIMNNNNTIPKVIISKKNNNNKKLVRVTDEENQAVVNIDSERSTTTNNTKYSLSSFRWQNAVYSHDNSSSRQAAEGEISFCDIRSIRRPPVSSFVFESPIKKRQHQQNIRTATTLLLDNIIQQPTETTTTNSSVTTATTKKDPLLGSIHQVTKGTQQSLSIPPTTTTTTTTKTTLTGLTPSTPRTTTKTAPEAAVAVATTTTSWKPANINNQQWKVAPLVRSDSDKSFKSFGCGDQDTIIESPPPKGMKNKMYKNNNNNSHKHSSFHRTDLSLSSSSSSDGFSGCSSTSSYHDDDNNDDNDNNTGRYNSSEGGTEAGGGEYEGGDGNRKTTPMERRRQQMSMVMSKYAKREAKQVLYARTFITILILVTASCLVAGTYIYLQQEERQDSKQVYSLSVNNTRVEMEHRLRQFTTEFQDLSEQITIAGLLASSSLPLSSTDLYLQQQQQQAENNNNNQRFLNVSSDNSNLEATTNTTDRIILESSTIAASNVSLFPFVPIPYFEVYAGNVRISTSVEMIMWVPFVSMNQWDQWNTYFEQIVPVWYNNTKELLEINNSTTIINSTNIISTTFDDMNNTTDILLQVTTVTTMGGDGNRLLSSSNISTIIDTGIHAPIFHTSPPPLNTDFLNYDTTQYSTIAKLIVPTLMNKGQGMFSPVDPTIRKLLDIVNTNWDPTGTHIPYSTTQQSNKEEPLLRRPETSPLYSGVGMAVLQRPHTIHIQPVLNHLDNNNNTNETRSTVVVGFLASIIGWDRYVAGLVPIGVNNVIIVLKNDCGQAYTYGIVDHQAQYIGEGDFHDPLYDYTEEIVPLTPPKTPGLVGSELHCSYSFYMYSSATLNEMTVTYKPEAFAMILSFVALVTCVAFCWYDRSVKQGLMKVANAAARSNAIVASLFPSHIRDQLLADQDTKDDDTMNNSQNVLRRVSGKFGSDILGLSDHGSTGFPGSCSDDNSVLFSVKPPIADLYTDTTVMFADIAGFTAWSSAREPQQVFVLLETVYAAFDEIAMKRRVYKVETVGDCYVAVTGLPEPRKDHAVGMCRFARDILIKMRWVTQKLERNLGPDTADLALRVGLHSGPVTAGVLRGQNSRFQLFGDTMNTAARVEQSGIRDKIQMSRVTADILVQAGKSRWITKREDEVFAKGKGMLETYWLLMKDDVACRVGSISCTSTSSEVYDGYDLEAADGMLANCHNPKAIRLIDWSVDVLLRLLRQIVTHRRASAQDVTPSLPQEDRYKTQTLKTFEEVREIITLPGFDTRAAQAEDSTPIELDTKVKQQVRNFVSSIAATYHDNPFHSFEHASHVTQSVVKLLSRVVAPTSIAGEETDEDGNCFVTLDMLHDHTYGITSDPLTQFACVFASLIHDADHPGVPNAQLIKENATMASYYKNKSVAEQNSVDLAWEMLMQDDYKDFRAAIYSSDEELIRFRQLIVNTVMATDIVDKELKTLRNDRWDRAFSATENCTESASETVNRKATIVIEHLIQASDVSHTMQHWNIYRSWNEKFFIECYKAFIEGRAETDPTTNWYQGEIGFFDFYIIPLAKKLKECGVFGVSSAEYLDYAMKNRQEWEARGQEVVSEMVETVHQMFGEQDAEFDIPNFVRDNL